MPLDDARQRLLAQVQCLPGTEQVATFDADGRVLAQDLVSALQVPAFDNSSMDGYAVRTADLARPDAVLRVTQRIPAGHNGQPLQPGEVARIFTGAPVPPGADAVVMQEEAELLRDAGGEAGGGRRCASPSRCIPANGSAAAARTCSAVPPCCLPAPV